MTVHYRKQQKPTEPVVRRTDSFFREPATEKGSHSGADEAYRFRFFRTGIFCCG